MIILNSEAEAESRELVDAPEVIEQANAKRKRMNTDARSIETDREGTALPDLWIQIPKTNTV